MSDPLKHRPLEAALKPYTTPTITVLRESDPRVAAMRAEKGLDDPDPFYVNKADEKPLVKRLTPQQRTLAMKQARKLAAKGYTVAQIAKGLVSVGLHVSELHVAGWLASEVKK